MTTAATPKTSKSLWRFEPISAFDFQQPNSLIFATKAALDAWRAELPRQRHYEFRAITDDSIVVWLTTTETEPFVAGDIIDQVHAPVNKVKRTYVDFSRTSTVSGDSRG